MAGGVRQLLGPLALELALGAAMSGADVLGQLLPGLAGALATGSLPAAAAHSGCASSTVAIEHGLLAESACQ